MLMNNIIEIRMLKPMILKLKDRTLWNFSGDCDSTGHMIRSFHRKRIGKSIRVRQGSRSGSKKPINSLKKGRKLFIGLSKFPAFQGNFNKAKKANCFVEQIHFNMIPPRLISIFRRSTNVKVSHNDPAYRIRHIDIFEPLYELSFLRVRTWSINISKYPMSIVMHRIEFNRQSIRILKN
jgi:hypothetical protein